MTLEGTPSIVNPAGISDGRVPRRGRDREQVRRPAARQGRQGAGAAGPRGRRAELAADPHGPVELRQLRRRDHRRSSRACDPSSASSSPATRTGSTSARCRTRPGSRTGRHERRRTAGVLVTDIDVDARASPAVRAARRRTSSSRTASNPTAPGSATRPATSSATPRWSTRRSRRSPTSTARRSRRSPTGSSASITADITRTNNAAGESALGDVIADAQLAYTAVAGAQIAFMNPGGIRADLTFANSPGGEAPGQVTYGEALHRPAVQQPGRHADVHRRADQGRAGAAVPGLERHAADPAGVGRLHLHLQHHRRRRVAGSATWR